MKANYLLTIKADDRPGLLHLVTGMINRRLIAIESLNAAKTDIRDIVLITIELNISEKALTPLLLKLENIIEVFSVEAALSAKVVALRSALFRLDKAFLETQGMAAITKHQGSIINIYPEAIVVGKSGSEAAIRSLYNELEGPHLLGFSQTGLIADAALIAHEDIERISRLAA